MRPLLRILSIGSANVADKTNKIRHFLHFQPQSSSQKMALGRLWEDCAKSRPASRRVRITPPSNRTIPVLTEVVVDGNIVDRVWRYRPLADSLGISTKTLQRLVARGAITTVQISDRIKGITESERRRFIESRTGGA